MGTKTDARFAEIQELIELGKRFKSLMEGVNGKGEKPKKDGRREALKWARAMRGLDENSKKHLGEIRKVHGTHFAIQQAEIVKAQKEA